MEYLAFLALKQEITADGGQSAELMARALGALADETSQVTARQLAAAMGAWGAKLLPAAAAMLGHKKASERQKGIELYAAIADPETIPKLEEARDNDRSKKLRRDYEYAIRRIRAAAAERARVRVDPIDGTIDPVARLVELANLSPDAFEALDGVEGSWSANYALPWLDFDRDGRRSVTLSGDTWHLVFEIDALQVEAPDGTRTRSLPTGADSAVAAAFDAVCNAVADAAKLRSERLEEALRTGRSWPGWLWRLLYVDHPLADRTTHTLVFEVEDGAARRTFRVTGEGMSVDAKGDAVEVRDTASVRVAHPAESALRAWQDVAAEQGWDPPFAQLNRTVFVATSEADLDDMVAALEVPYASTLAARLDRAGFQRSEVDEHGSIVERFRALGGGVFLCVRHGVMHVRQSMIDKQARAPIRRAWFQRGEELGATAVPARVYSEGVLLLQQLAGAD